ncbi:hypothetical protein LL912_18350 [Niabella sp. CC-SYL272]|uniref:hypothetical protein n=1 Tax=Niabella agricola TaxID=2891571 RepID=UPI001F1C9260|nr:hypothetical protein [Niabella agricola]MCF3110751.1 hypothetical protein [Niabella agricola]
MKYRLLLAIFILSLSESHAQFLLKPEGFATARGNEYYVVEVPGTTQQQLFEAVECRVKTGFGSFQDRIAAIPYGEIVFQATDRQALHYSGRSYDVTFQAGFEFKDGKIKVNAPVIKNIRSFNPMVDSVASVLFIKSPGPMIFQEWRSFVFDKKNRLKNRLLKETLELFVNKRLLQPLLAINTNEAW